MAEFAVLFIAEISPCDNQSRTGSCRAWSRKPRPPDRAEKSDSLTEPAEAGKFGIYHAHRGN